jgi:cell division protease FtsH
VFLDEVDAVGRRRGSGLGGGHDEREQTLNAILVEMDGFDSDEGVILIAATNRPDVLDPALLRPGRFDREITIDLPDIEGREQILKVHANRVSMDPAVDLQRAACGTPGFSGAELAALVNEAAIIAAMKDQDAIYQQDLEEARDKLRYGLQKKSRVMVHEDRLITAYHEAGHAIVAHLLPEVEPLHKVTIIPRGMALGLTMQLPERDRYHLSRQQVFGNLKLLYAGRIAEERFCGDVTSGAASDIERATELVRRMVCEWGMSDAIGPINYRDNEETLFLGREVTRSRDHSDAIALRIDEEVRRIVDTCYADAEKLIDGHLEEIERIAQALMERETLTGEEVALVVRGETLPPLSEKASKSAPALETDAPEAGTSEVEAGAPAGSRRGTRVAGEVAVAEASVEGRRAPEGNIGSSG